jgi:hypothetical protein
MASFTANIAYSSSEIQQAIGTVDSADSNHHRIISLDYGVNQVDPAQSILLLAIFLTGALALLYDLREGTLNSVFRIINRSIVAPWDLNTFLHLESEPPESNQYYSFAEEAVVWGTDTAGGLIRPF